MKLNCGNIYSYYYELVYSPQSEYLSIISNKNSLRKLLLFMHCTIKCLRSSNCIETVQKKFRKSIYLTYKPHIIEIHSFEASVLVHFPFQCTIACSKTTESSLAKQRRQDLLNITKPYTQLSVPGGVFGEYFVCFFQRNYICRILIEHLWLLKI